LERLRAASCDYPIKGNNVAANFETLELESALRAQRAEFGAANAFITVARIIGRHKYEKGMLTELEQTVGHFAAPFVRASVAGQTIDSVWLETNARDLAVAFLGSIAPSSLLDSIARFARPIPLRLGRILVASGAVADVAAEGEPKVITRLNTTSPDGDLIKAAAILVYSNELSEQSGGQARQLFAEELRKAVITAFNQALLNQLTITSIAATGTAVGDLRAGIAAAEVSANYVIAAQPSAVVELAFESQGRMGPGGGEFLPGVHLIPVEASSGSPQMTVIPADRIALADGGLVVRSASEASVQMSDTPSGSGQLTSLWQTDCRAVLVERSFRLIGAANAIDVG
jgi:hypothetical protein